MGIVSEVKAGRPVPVPVIDAHTHLFECSNGGMHQGFHSVADTVKLMDAVGIDAIVTSPIIMDAGYSELANRQTVEAMAEFPDRIYGKLVVTPHDGAESVKDMIRRYSRIEGFVALKMLTGYHGAPTRQEYAYAFEFAQECGCPVTLHFWEDEAINHENVTEILERYPKLKVILAHQGGGVRHMTIRTAKLMKQCDRLYIDTCGSLWNRLGIDEIADLVGDDRLCYGSDILFMEPRFEIGRIVFSGLPEETQRKIFSENYLKILEGSQLGQIKLP